MSYRFSARTGWDVGESGFAAAIRETRAAGRELVDLTVSNPTVCGFDYDAGAVLAPLASREAMTYDPDPRGMRFAREAVAGYYGGHRADVDPDSVVLTTSTSEGYGYLFRLLCDAGDEVLVARPSYPLFDFLADLEDVRLRPYPLFYDYGWWIDFAELERRIGPRTKAVVVVHPNNPTGHATGAGERGRLEEICARHGLALIVDEVFLDYPLEEGEAGELCSGSAPGADVCAERDEQDCRAAADEGWVDRGAGAGGGSTAGNGAAGGGCGYLSVGERADAAGAAGLAGGEAGDSGADSGAGEGESGACGWRWG
ncbi:pyridoxal phosphate-dependent aminotransferase [Tunturiibacter empetritectus]|uniref:aminotransferase class I/II-fold pyridoxal phosphate-dependent enzyme n=1 Tax=Tunturiibacter empetritectus TaxID=3069691 RepID=UPI003D9B5AAC